MLSVLCAGLKPLHQGNHASGCGVLRPGVARREMMFSFPADPDPLQEENHKLIWLRKNDKNHENYSESGLLYSGFADRASGDKSQNT